MKKSIFLIALTIGLAACSSDVESSQDSPLESQGGNDAKVKEMERLTTERDSFYNKHIQSLSDGAVDEANAFKAQMDSVDAIYQELLRN